MNPLSVGMSARSPDYLSLSFILSFSFSRFFLLHEVSWETSCDDVSCQGGFGRGGPRREMRSRASDLVGSLQEKNKKSDVAEKISAGLPVDAGHGGCHAAGPVTKLERQGQA